MSSVITTAIAGVAPAPKKTAIGAGSNSSDNGGSSAASEEATSEAPVSTAAAYDPYNITTYDYRANVKLLQVPQERQNRLIDLIG